MKKYLAVALSLVIVLGGLVSCGKKDDTLSKKEEKPEVIRIGSVNGDVGTVVYKEKKLFENEFEKDGIKIEYAGFEAGPTVIDSFISNKLDVAKLGDQPIVAAIATGVDIKVIGGTIASPKFVGLVVNNKSDINSPKDLKGKKIGVAVGTIYHHLLSGYLEQNNLKFTDVQVVNLKFSDSIATLAQGDVDAVVVGEPYLSIIKGKNIGKLVADGEGVLRPTTPIVISNEFQKKYPEVSKRILKVYKEANTWISANKDEAATLGTKEIPLPKETLKNFIELGGTDIDITPELKNELKSTYKFLKETGLANGDIKDWDKVYIELK